MKLKSGWLVMLGMCWGLVLGACALDSRRAGEDSPPLAPSSTPRAATITAAPSPTATVFPTTNALLTATPTALACWGEGGQISAQYIPSDLLPKRMDFMLYLPPCYEEQPMQRYPVLYLIHGKSATHTQWDRIGADEIADGLIASGEIAPFIIVMPRDRIWVEPEDDPFGEALIQELIPWIDQNYRTVAEREYRAIGGLSRGAAWAVHLGLGYWELFGAVGAHSMALFWEDVGNIPRWLEQMQPDGAPRIFVDVGRRDFEEIRDSTDWFGELLTELDIPHEWYFFTGTHNEEYWASHLEQYLRFYALEW